MSNLSNTAVITGASALVALGLLGTIALCYIVRVLGSSRVAVRSYANLNVIDDVRVYGSYWRYDQWCVLLDNGWCGFHNCCHWPYGYTPYTTVQCTHDQCATKKHDHPEFAELARKNEALALRVDRLTTAHNALARETARHARRLRRLERLVRVLRSRFVGSPTGILWGMLCGGVIGAIIGLVIDWLLPRSTFEIVGQLQATVGEQTLNAVMPMYDRWPAYGIIHMGATGGMLLGGLIVGIIGLVGRIRARRQARAVTQTTNPDIPAQAGPVTPVVAPTNDVPASSNGGAPTPSPAQN